MMVTSNRFLTPRRRAAGFSLTELLVVIGIIALLVGLLLVALGQVRTKAKDAETTSVMQAFSAACQTFQMDHGFYPGVIPENILVRNNQIGGDAPRWLTSTENALLHLMGGYRLRTPLDLDGSPAAVEYDNYESVVNQDFMVEYLWNIGSRQWRLKVDLNRIGEGPIVAGKRHDAYFNPEKFVKPVAGQDGDPPDGGDIRQQLPDLIDSWGQPILYFRRMNKVGTLASGNLASNPQFTMKGNDSYLLSESLGELGQRQPFNNTSVGSLLAMDITGNIDNVDRYKVFMQCIRNKAIGAAEDYLTGTPRGSFALISAGPDGIFFSAADGPGRADAMVGGTGGMTLDEFIDLGPDIFKEFDDIRVFGGG